MKKYVSILLSVVLVLSLVACGAKTTSNSDDSSKASQKEEKAGKNDNSEGIETKKDKTEDNDNEDEKDGSQKEAKDDVTTDDPTTPNIKEAIDNKECSIKITDVDPDGEMGCTLKVQLENKSDKTNQMFSIKDSSVNGVTYHVFFAPIVNAGEKIEEEIFFDKQMLEYYEIKKCTDIEMTFHVYDSDGPCEEPLVADTIHVYPYGIENATIFVNHVQPSDQLIMDNENIIVTVKEYKLEDVGYHVKFYLMNKTNKSIIVSAEDVSINGTMAEPYFDPLVSPQKVAFGFMMWDNDTLQENKIDQVKEIKFKLRVRDIDDLLGDDLVNEEITLNP